jgi:hypothetical protein
VGQAEYGANKDADTALERARHADKVDDSTTCAATLGEARQLCDTKE